MCNIYNQLGTPGTVKSFLGGSQFFKAMFNSFDLCSTQFSRGGEKFCREVPGYGPEHMFEEQGRTQGGGVNTPLELDILQKFYHLRNEIKCFRILFAC